MLEGLPKPQLWVGYSPNVYAVLPVALLQVIFRVGATVVGACLGHALMFHPATGMQHCRQHGHGVLSCVNSAISGFKKKRHNALHISSCCAVNRHIVRLFCWLLAAAYNPWILGAANIFFCLLVTPASMGQFRLVVVLGLLTFASVTLCQYVGCCGAVGSLTYLVGRILATGGLYCG